MQASTERAYGGIETLRRPDVAKATGPDALNLLEQFGTTLRCARDQEVYAEGTQADHCYRIISGCVRTVCLIKDGRRQIGEFLLMGDFFGLDDLGSHAFAAEAVSETVLRRYPRRMVEALAESHPALGRRLRELALVHLRAAQERVVLLGRKTASERLATFVLELDGRSQGRTGGRLTLPMSRADIADHLGLTVETVCRVLAQLKRDGIVGVARSGLDLRDRVALRQLT